MAYEECFYSDDDEIFRRKKHILMEDSSDDDYLEIEDTSDGVVEHDFDDDEDPVFERSDNN